MKIEKGKDYMIKVAYSTPWSNQACVLHLYQLYRYSYLKEHYHDEVITNWLSLGCLKVISEVIPKKNLNALDGLCKIHSTYMENANEQLPERSLTFGEKMVGLNFNPGGNSAVDECKRTFAKAIDQMNDLRNDPITTPEAKRLASVAITEMQGAQMWAVKAITWRD